MALLKGPCEEIGWDLIRKAERIGVFRQMVEEMRKDYIEHVQRWPSMDPDIIRMREMQRREISVREHNVDMEEAELMDDLVKMIGRCSREMIE